MTRELEVDRLNQELFGSDPSIAVREVAGYFSHGMASLQPPGDYPEFLQECVEWLTTSVEHVDHAFISEAMISLSAIARAYGRKVYPSAGFKEPDSPEERFGLHMGSAMADLDVNQAWRIVKSHKAPLNIGTRRSSNSSLGSLVIGSFQHVLQSRANYASDELVYELTAGHTELPAAEQLRIPIELAVLTQPLFPHQIVWSVFPPSDGSGIKLRHAPANFTDPERLLAVEAVEHLVKESDSPITTNHEEILQLVRGSVAPNVVAIRPKGIQEVREHFRVAA